MSMKVITEKEMERILQEEPDEAKVFEAVRKYRAQREEGEDKDEICELLCKTLQATRQHRDLEAIHYQMLDNGDETVTVKWSKGGTTIVNVTADSGIAMIRDILRAIK